MLGREWSLIGAVMPVGFQYAVIEVRRTAGPPERFVLAYPDERSLRDLIAAPNIVGCGFTTRTQAQAHIEEQIRGLSRNQWQKDRCGRRREMDRPSPGAKQRLRGLRLMEAGTIVRSLFRRAIVAALLTFRST